LVWQHKCFWNEGKKVIQKTGASSITNLGFSPGSFLIISGGLEALGAEYGILEKLDAAAPPM